jgi:plasmid stabilization system protein ParE
VTRVDLTPAALEDLDRLIVTHSLPDGARARVDRSLRVLERFPKIGRKVGGRWSRLRLILGPWRWLLIVYLYDEERDLVSVLTIQDARSSTAVTSLAAPG